MTNIVSPRPFIKWAGGKQAIAAEIVGRFPAKMGTYYEPFLGGGSVFFELAPTRAVLADSNGWLVDTYKAIRNDATKVARELDGLVNTKDEFLRIRAVSPDTLELPRRAAHFIYLNKTCFRGLYRVNRSGQFNVPYGAYERRYYDIDELKAASIRLKGVELLNDDFEVVLANAKRGDFVYLDPPYYKLGGYSDFNRYTPGQFREADHERLASLCVKLDRRGVKWALSNSDTPLVRELFRDFEVGKVKARREINLNSRRRDIEELYLRASRKPDAVNLNSRSRDIEELLISNYEQPVGRPKSRAPRVQDRLDLTPRP